MIKGTRSAIVGDAGSSGQGTSAGGISFKTALAITFTVVCWAGAFAGIREAVKYFSPGPLALARYVVASVVLAALVLLSRTPLPSWKEWHKFALVGAVGVTAYNLALNYGSQFIQSGSAAFLVNTAPIFTMIFSMLMLKERVPPVAVGGIMLGFVGATLILLGEGKDFAVEPAALLILVAAVVFSLYFILQKPLLQRYTSLQVVSLAVWIGTLFMVPMSLNVGAELAAASSRSIGIVVLLGVFPGALAYASWSFVLSKIPASRAGTFIYCVAPTTVLIAWLWLDEVPTALSLVGGCLALAGVVIVSARGRAQAAVQGLGRLIGRLRTGKVRDHAD